MFSPLKYVGYLKINFHIKKFLRNERWKSRTNVESKRMMRVEEKWNTFAIASENMKKWHKKNVERKVSVLSLYLLRIIRTFFLPQPIQMNNWFHFLQRFSSFFLTYFLPPPPYPPSFICYCYRYSVKSNILKSFLKFEWQLRIKK